MVLFPKLLMRNW